MGDKNVVFVGGCAKCGKTATVSVPVSQLWHGKPQAQRCSMACGGVIRFDEGPTIIVARKIDPVEVAAKELLDVLKEGK